MGREGGGGGGTGERGGGEGAQPCSEFQVPIPAVYH